MKAFAAALLCALLAIPAQADEAPTAAKNPHRLLDRKAILAGLTLLAGEIADNETTMAAMRRNHQVTELNPFYGSHPSRLRMYSIGTALTGLMFLTALAVRQQALRRGRENSKRWLIPVVIGDSVRGWAAWHNSRLPSRQPNAPKVCPAAGAGCP